MKKDSNQEKQEPSHSNLKPVHYERVGKMMVSIVETSYAKRWRIYYFSTVKGFFSGLGGVIGATVGVALLLYILSFFDSVPVIDHFIQLVQGGETTLQ